MSLASAMSSSPLVSILRKRLDKSPYYGFMVAESPLLIAIHSVSDRYDLDGYRVFRRSDASDVAYQFARADLIRRALRLKNLAPCELDWLDLSTVRAVIESIQAHYPVVVINRELVCPDECEIGTVQMTSDSSYVLRWLNVNAEWELDNRTFQCDEVTQLSFGGGYETTLAMVAEDRAAG